VQVPGIACQEENIEMIERWERLQRLVYNEAHCERKRAAAGSQTKP